MSAVWASGGSVAQFAAIRSVGFEPVGQVTASAVHHLGGWGQDFIACEDLPFDPVSSTDAELQRQTPWERETAASRAEVRYEIRRTAMDLLAARCAKLGGDGVIGVTLTVRPFPEEPRLSEVVALGTAVRAGGGIRPPCPFLSHLSGQDFAKLLGAGWVPVDLVLGVAITSRHRTGDREMDRHDSPIARMAGPLFSRESPRFTSLILSTRRQARERFLHDSERAGGDGAVLADESVLLTERECVRRGKHLLVEAVFVGTSVTRFSTRARAGALTIMRL